MIPSHLLGMSREEYDQYFVEKDQSVRVEDNGRAPSVLDMPMECETLSLFVEELTARKDRVDGCRVQTQVRLINGQHSSIEIRFSARDANLEVYHIHRFGRVPMEGACLAPEARKQVDTFLHFMKRRLDDLGFELEEPDLPGPAPAPAC